MNTNRKLYRSRDDQMIAGVCAGLAEYFDMDPSIMRILFVALALSFGHGLLVYLLLLLVMPIEPV